MIQWPADVPGHLVHQTQQPQGDLIRKVFWYNLVKSGISVLKHTYKNLCLESNVRGSKNVNIGNNKYYESILALICLGTRKKIRGQTDRVIRSRMQIRISGPEPDF